MGSEVDDDDDDEVVGGCILDDASPPNLLQMHHRLLPRPCSCSNQSVAVVVEVVVLSAQVLLRHIRSRHPLFYPQVILPLESVDP